MRDLKLSLVCPVYNEGANIGPLTERLGREIDIPSELIVVYDRDDDDTLAALARARTPFPVRTVKNRFGIGALNAIKTGLANKPKPGVMGPSHAQMIRQEIEKALAAVS